LAPLAARSPRRDRGRAHAWLVLVRGCVARSYIIAQGRRAHGQGLCFRSAQSRSPNNSDLALRSSAERPPLTVRLSPPPPHMRSHRAARSTITRRRGRGPSLGVMWTER
jgi:hypothetical protein